MLYGLAKFILKVYMADEGGKHSTHKYYKRIGSPGNYTYFYTKEQHERYLNGQNKKEISNRDLLKFTYEAITGDGKTNEEVFMARVSNTAKDRLNKKFQLDVDDIVTDTYSVRHAYKKASHNLEPNDIIHAVEVINTSTDIKAAGEHRNNPAFIFKKDINGEISFLVEARIKKRKLAIFNFYRKKKARQKSDATL